MKIQIIGAPGSGKSTLARYIGKEQSIPWLDTDNYLWQDDQYTVNYPVQERFQLYAQDRQGLTDYVVSGSIFSWHKEGFGDRELMVLLLLDDSIRMARLRKRELKRYGDGAFTLDDNGNITNEFLEWSQTYKTAGVSSVNSLENHWHQIDYAACPFLVIDADAELQVLYQKVMDEYNALYP